MRDLINEQLCDIVGKVPSEVETRWFSRFNTIKFLLKKKVELISLREDLLNNPTIDESDKLKYKDILKDANFEKIVKFVNIMLPIYSATLYFDSNISKACAIVPISL